ncbi:uncharacterized protein PV07_12236 [Cladophialophora immunda]|uniref:Uncharacterized protein n=1 Tax=Cladophialophora immunda TaxID=569365 RepID=A0A0D2CFL1_9EURO|nr:uncharacterized protein PV07_12236 [Cladophialophora immunda]KIW22339.1 hypothetical protein PV07_12236 [Cladophialophora immunda]
MNEPAMISFFSITGVILLVAGIAIWRTYHKSRMHDKPNDETAIENNGDPRHGVQNLRIRAGNTADLEQQADNQGGRWRWRKILDRVSWAQVPNSAEDPEEMRAMERQQGVNEKADQAIVSGSISGVEAGTRDLRDVEKGPRPTDVASFEKLGGYRYGDFAYGHDNMAPLPVPTLVEYRHAPGIAEVEAVPACSYPSQVCDRDSIEAGHRPRLTSYNGFPPMHQHRDDVMAALPIPKDHPLSQHYPVAQCPAPSTIPHQDAGWKPPVFQYERDSLVPAPLNPRRGRHNPDMDQDDNQPSTTKPVRIAGLTLERPSSAHSRRAPTSRSASKEGHEERYSVFESPLRQHPPELNNELQDPRKTLGQTSVHTPRSMVGEGRATDDVRNDWPLTTDMKNCSFRSPNQPVSVSEHRHHPHQRHRHFSSCDAAWTTFPLTPSSQSSRKPSRWSWTAENFRVAGMEGENVV